MTDTPETAGRLRRTRVVAKAWVTPRIVRITLGGDLDDFRDQGTDQHVAIYFYPPEALVPDPLDQEELAALHEFAMPMMRRYTIRRFDPGTRQVEMDFVVHEPAGLASSWARDAEVGDELIWWGPTHGWQLPRDVHTLLLVGDETALPAIDAILREAPAGVRAVVLAEVADAADEHYLAHHTDRAEFRWVHRGEPTGEVGTGFAEAVETLAALGPGPVAVWAGLEFAGAGLLRRRLFGTLGLTKDEAFVVSYWIWGQPQDLRPDERNRRRTLRNRLQHPDRARRHVRIPG